MRTIALVTLVLGAVAVAEETPMKQVEIGAITWYVEYDDALEVAQREGKPLWLHFGENPG